MHLHGKVPRWLAPALLASGCLITTSVSVTPDASAASDPITIGFVPENISNAFFVMMHYGALKEAKALGVKLLFEGTTATPSPTTQLPYVDAVLAQHPSAFVLGPTDPNALIPAVRQARSEGIPVINVDTTISDTSLLASRITGDNAGGGKLAANILNHALHGRGQVLVMAGSPSFTTENLRKQGFTKQLAEFPGLKYDGFLDTNDVASTSESDTAHALSRFPKLGGIFAVDDFIASGVVTELNSLKETAQVKTVAYDAEPDEVTELRKGEVLALVAQRAAVEGSLAVLYAYDEVTHHTGGVVRSVVLPDILLTRSSLGKDSKWFYCSSLATCSGAWQPTKANGVP